MSQHIVYVVFDILDDACVYVGQTGDYRARMQQHRSKSPWMNDPIRIETTECPSRDHAIWLESVLISLLDPRANKVGRSPERVRFRDGLHRKALAEPRGALFCDCDFPEVDRIGMCQTCKRKPAELLRVPA